jgi:hypothetical protein
MNTRFLSKIGAFLCASVMAASIASAGNVLVNPGFESPVFVSGGWTAFSTESWSMNQLNALVHTGADALWMQGLYGNGGAPAHYNMYAYQKIACAPGSTFTAGASFSQFVADISGEGGDNGNSLDPTGPYYSSGLFATDGSGQEDGWVEVMFIDANNNVLSDYKSTIMTPAYESSLITAGNVVTNYALYNVNTTTMVTNYDKYLAWVDCEITNQYDISTIGGLNANIDPATESVTNTLASGQYMVAPVGTAYVEYRVGLCQAAYEAGAAYWDDCSLNLVGGPGPSVIGNITPDGSHFFNIAATSFNFTVTSAASGGATLPTNPNSGVTVMVNGQNQSANLQFSGTPTALSVSLPGFTSNKLYSVSITVSNSAGLLSTASSTFDTFAANNVVIPAETYDFSNGQFNAAFVPTNAPGSSSYWGVAGVAGVDYYMVPGAGVPGGGSSLAPNYPDRGDAAVAFQVASDLNLPLYQAQSNAAIYNVCFSYNNGGDWFNYTRSSWPSGYFLVYARISSGNGTPGGLGNYEALNIVTSGHGTATQTTNNLGYFSIVNGVNWNSFSWVPLTDANGNVIPVNIPSGQQTLQLLSGGGLNFIDFMFVPVTSGLPPQISNINPFSSQTVFVNASSVTFSVSSITSTLSTNNIHSYYNGVSLPETFTGASTNWSVTVPLSLTANQQNQSFAISAVDNSGQSNGVSETFDTFSQNNFMIEADAFDFNGGQYITNPIETATATGDPNSYYFYPAGNPDNSAEYGVDYTATNVAGEQYSFRVDGNTPGTVSVTATAVGTEGTSDFLRGKFINEGPSAQAPFEYVPEEAAPSTNSDYDVGWWPPGTWMNYTRTIPTNNYYVYGRLAYSGAYSGAKVSLVTVGRGTTSQTTQLLGTFSDANANGFQSWHWVPLMSNSQQVVVSLGGTETFQIAAPPGSATGSLNSHFYMLVPAVLPLSFSVSASASGGTVTIHIPTQSGHSYTVYYSGSLSSPNWQTLGSSITGDGTVKTATDSVSGTARFYRVQAQ